MGRDGSAVDGDERSLAPARCFVDGLRRKLAPVPDSPEMKTGASLCATLASERNMARIGAQSPIILPWPTASPTCPCRHAMPCACLSVKAGCRTRTACARNRCNSRGSGAARARRPACGCWWATHATCGCCRLCSSSMYLGIAVVGLQVDHAGHRRAGAHDALELAQLVHVPDIPAGAELRSFDTVVFMARRPAPARCVSQPCIAAP